ncbi:MAG TPA: tRNA pseudouridine(55) synthase TruB [Desulfuromonadaceae bacterium]|jgi:tRNA pseudouridine55 synthase
MNGFIIIDKPAGITSHDVVSRVRRILGTKKVGHTGTLDPFATGVLPVAVNEGTKAIPYLDEGRKCYQALMRLGVTTDTLDMTGKVLSETDSSLVDEQLLRSLLLGFTGPISQVPPMFSAIKLGGQPLYKLARQGQEIEREPRQVEIYELELISYRLPFVEIRVVCSRGTYIRSLADDIGSALGCGAALQELRRTASGPFAIEAAVSLETLEESVHKSALDELFISPYQALNHLLDIPLADSGLLKVSHGISPGWDDTSALLPNVCQESELVRLSREYGLIAIAQLQPNCGSAQIVLKRVFN